MIVGGRFASEFNSNGRCSFFPFDSFVFLFYLLLFFFFLYDEVCLRNGEDNVLRFESCITESIESKGRRLLKNQHILNDKKNKKSFSQ